MIPVLKGMPLRASNIQSILKVFTLYVKAGKKKKSPHFFNANFHFIRL